MFKKKTFLLSKMYCTGIVLTTFLTLASCVTSPTPQASTRTSGLVTPLSPEDEVFVKQFTKDLNVNHVIVGCVIYDLTFKVEKRLPGSWCWPESSGELILQGGDTLGRIDKKANVLWKKNPVLLQHVLQKSKIKDEYLALISEYVNDQKDGLSRYDKLVVFDESGNTVKSFSFADYFKQHPEIRPPSAVNEWSPDKNAKKSVEYMHGNSFGEIYSEKNGKKTLKAYLFNSLFEKKIYFFDKNLKKITGHLKTGDFDFHDVHQFAEGHLIAYTNAEGNNFGSVRTIDLNTKKFTTLYSFTDSRQASRGCSSVDYIEGDRLFIVHSKCSPSSKAAEAGFYLEFVYLKTGRNALIHLNTPVSPQDGRLVDLSSFLSNISY